MTAGKGTGFPSPAHSCLEGWQRFESSTLSDPRLREECERRTHALCLGELSSSGTLGTYAAACALHCLLCGGSLPEPVLQALRSLAQGWQDSGVTPAYSAGAPTPPSLLELYITVKEVLLTMRHPQSGLL